MQSILAPLNAEIEHQLVFTLSSATEAMDIFEEVASANGFEMIEREETHCTAVKRPPSKSPSLLDYLNCLIWYREPSILTVIKLTTYNGQSIGKLEGLVGDLNIIKEFRMQFDKLIGKQSAVKKAFLIQEPSSSARMEIGDPFYLEARCIHMVNLLLMNDLKVQTKKMLDDFHDSFKNIQESITLLPLPMKSAISIINQIAPKVALSIDRMAISKEIQIYTRISLEKYIFEKVEHSLFSIYSAKNINSCQQFIRKRNIILQRYTLRQMMEEVSLNQKFWSLDMSAIDSKVTFHSGKQSIRFLTVSKELEKIVYTHSPREKIKHCQLMYTELKTHFYDYSKGKYQLNSMEDIIPVMIIVMLFTKVEDLRSQFDIMIDFLSYDEVEMEIEKRLLINMSESYNYVVRDWVVEQQ